jgi:hypothetical protein
MAHMARVGRWSQAREAVVQGDMMMGVMMMMMLTMVEVPVNVEVSTTTVVSFHRGGRIFVAALRYHVSRAECPKSSSCSSLLQCIYCCGTMRKISLVWCESVDGCRFTV